MSSLKTILGSYPLPPKPSHDESNAVQSYVHRVLLRSISRMSPADTLQLKDRCRRCPSGKRAKFPCHACKKRSCCKCVQDIYLCAACVAQGTRLRPSCGANDRATQTDDLEPLGMRELPCHDEGPSLWSMHFAALRIADP